MNNRNLEYDKALITTLRQNYGDTYLISDEYAHKKTSELVQVEPTCTDPSAHEPHEIIYIRFSDDGTAIRKWQRSPFDGSRKCRVAMTVTTDGENLVARLQSGGQASLAVGAHARDLTPSRDAFADARALRAIARTAGVTVEDLLALAASVGDA